MIKTYLDYNATTPLFPEVISLMSELAAHPHNASSIHGLGREGRKLIEQARAQVGALCGIEANQVIFNSGATEANNTVLNHFKGERILTAPSEHAAVLDVVGLPGHDAVHIPVDENGMIDLATLEKELKAEKTALVSIMAVNNQTGVIQPIQEVAALAHQYGALYHCDGAQAGGKIPLNMQEMGIDFLTLSAHKLGGPQGVGALILGFCGETPTLLHGGGQEKSARAGTQNVIGIAGFGLAYELAAKNLDDYQKLAELRDELEAGLLETTPQIIIHGKDAPRVANTSMFSVPEITSDRMLIALDLQGIAVSNGSACSSGSVQPSHVLKAMGASDKEATSALRFSLGWNSKKEDIQHALSAWANLPAIKAL